MDRRGQPARRGVACLRVQLTPTAAARRGPGACTCGDHRRVDRHALEAPRRRIFALRPTASSRVISPAFPGTVSSEKLDFRSAPRGLCRRSTLSACAPGTFNSRRFAIGARHRPCRRGTAAVTSSDMISSSTLFLWQRCSKEKPTGRTPRHVAAAVGQLGRVGQLRPSRIGALRNHAFMRASIRKTRSRRGVMCDPG